MRTTNQSKSTLLLICFGACLIVTLGYYFSKSDATPQYPHATARLVLETTPAAPIGPIWEAAKKGDIENLQQILDLQGISAFQQCQAGHSLLHVAAAHNQVATIDFIYRALDEHGLATDMLNLQQGGSAMQTPFYTAVTSGSEAAALKLYALDCQTHLPMNNGTTPCHAAARTGNLKLLALCLDKTNSNAHLVDITDENGFTPLMIAAISGQQEVFQHLLAQGAKTNFVTAFDQATLLHCAVVGGNTHILTTILEKDKQLNTFNGLGQTPLHYAVEYAQPESVKLLLQYKADTKLTNKDDQTPYQLAKSLYQEAIDTNASEMIQSRQTILDLLKS